MMCESLAMGLFTSDNEQGFILRRRSSPVSSWASLLKDPLISLKKLLLWSFVNLLIYFIIGGSSFTLHKTDFFTILACNISYKKSTCPKGQVDNAQFI
jgi:hypothetical protein